MFIVNCIEMTKMKKKRPRIAHLKKRRLSKINRGLFLFIFVFSNKIVDFRWIWTRIIGGEDENTDPLTTTTTQWKKALSETIEGKNRKYLFCCWNKINRAFTSIRGIHCYKTYLSRNQDFPKNKKKKTVFFWSRKLEQKFKRKQWLSKFTLKTVYCF